MVGTDIVGSYPINRPISHLLTSLVAPLEFVLFSTESMGIAFSLKAYQRIGTLQLPIDLQTETNVEAMICRNCGAGLEADKIDAKLSIVTCSHCGSLHDMPGDSLGHSADDATNPKSGSTALPKLERQEVALPDRFKVHRTNGAMEITWPVGGLFQAFVLLIIAGAFAYVALMQGVYPLIVVSLGLVYFAAVRAVNQHRIRTSSDSLQVKQGPLPWSGSRKLNASDIDQLFSTEYETRNETGNNNDRRIEVRKHYQLSANTRDNKRVTLLRGLGDPLQALWLEQEIERALGIRDKRVAGEHWQ